ncbi:hypothetical protein [Alkaliphilus hydrothermalis]|uniref:hypothetical protein n=1 Tax=Alkaliphilus hydrothermalis TaxID=1482730 RepID=UPI001959C96D|nr:hypothetical protein [Alkaliphilus hydrothermalis]
MDEKEVFSKSQIQHTFYILQTHETTPPKRATAIFRDITFTTTIHRLYSIVIAFLIVLNEGVVIPYLIRNNLWKDIRLEILILRGMNIVMSPLTKGNTFRNK